MKRTLMILALGCAALSASAQETKPMGMSFKIGNFWPSSGEARTAGGSWIGFGFDMKLRDLKYANSGRQSTMLTLSGDVLNKNNFRNAPILLNYVSRTDKMYTLAGAGASFAKWRSGSENESGVIFAYSLGVGMDLQQGGMPMFAELRYLGTMESKLNGFGLFLGVRF